MTESTISNHWGVAAPLRYFHKPLVSELMNELINYGEAVCRTVSNQSLQRLKSTSLWSSISSVWPYSMGCSLFVAMNRDLGGNYRDRVPRVLWLGFFSTPFRLRTLDGQSLFGRQGRIGLR